MIRSRPRSPRPPRSPPSPEAASSKNLIDIYFSPREAFTRIVRKPTFLLPLIGHIVLVLAFTGIWIQKMDAREFMKVQLEESGQWDKIPAEQRETIIEQQAKWMPIFAWIGPVAQRRCFSWSPPRRSCSSFASSTRARCPSGRPSRSRPGPSSPRASSRPRWCSRSSSSRATGTSIRRMWSGQPGPPAREVLGREAALGPSQQHRHLLPVDGLPARGRLRRRQPEGDGVRDLGCRHPVDPDRPRQGRLGGDLLAGRGRPRSLARRPRPRYSFRSARRP